MSSQKGNTRKSGPPKHKNHTAYKNNLHDTSKQTKEINSLEVVNCCDRCTEVISWKIKYKKYKPLTAPKKCTKCFEKSVKRAYCIVCDGCCKKLQLCAKCGGQKDIVASSGLSPAMEASQRSQFEQEIAELPERKRRTFLRLLENGKLTAADVHQSSSVTSDDCSSCKDTANDHQNCNKHNSANCNDFSDDDFDEDDDDEEEYEDN